MSFLSKLRRWRGRPAPVPTERRGPPGTGAGATEHDAGPPVLDASVTPELKPLPQPSPTTCWAATGAMLQSWQAKRDLSIEEVLDGLGDDWRAKFDAGEGLSPADLAAFARALGLVEQKQYSVLQLAETLRDHGLIWVISDDPFDGNATVHLRVVAAMKGTAARTARC